MKNWKYKASTAIGALMGTVVGLLADNVSSATAWVLPLTAGEKSICFFFSQ